MKVLELIAQLKKYPPEMRVIVSGYEDGVDDVFGINEVPIKLNQNTEWYYGKHEICEYYPLLDNEDEMALLIEGGSTSERQDSEGWLKSEADND